MSYLSWVDIADVTFNSTDLKAYLKTITGLKQTSLITTWAPPGSTADSIDATGRYTYEPVVITWMYEDSATGPNVKCAQDTSATLTVTLKSGESWTGTAVVTEREVVTTPEDDNELITTHTWNGAPTIDIAA